MTCRCRTEFCYLCHARWKTCQCPQWDERRLLAAAEERVDAELGMGQELAGVRPFAPAPVPAQRRVPPPLPPRVLAPVRPPAVEFIYHPPTPARMPTTSRSTGRPAHTAWTQPREGTDHKVKRSRSAHPAFVPTRTLMRTATSTSALVSTSTPRPSIVRPKSVHNPDLMRQGLVREMMERLRVDHDCDHGRWHYRRGGGTCQTPQIFWDLRQV